MRRNGLVVTANKLSDKYARVPGPLVYQPRSSERPPDPTPVGRRALQRKQRTLVKAALKLATVDPAQYKNLMARAQALDEEIARHR